jgi:hypothetical protein
METTSIVNYEARMDDWDEMQNVMNDITSGSPVDNGWIAEVEHQEEFDRVDPSIFDQIDPIPFD